MASEPRIFQHLHNIDAWEYMRGMPDKSVDVDFGGLVVGVVSDSEPVGIHWAGSFGVACGGMIPSSIATLRCSDNVLNRSSQWSPRSPKI